MTTIIVTHEDDSVDEFAFESGQNPIAIGRRSGNDVCIPSLSVSGRHARVIFDDDRIWLEDLQSTNGTYFNGQIVRRHPLRDGDELILGKIRIRFDHLNTELLEGQPDLFTASIDDPGPLEDAQVPGPATASLSGDSVADQNTVAGPFAPDVTEQPTQTLSRKADEALGSHAAPRHRPQPISGENAHPLDGLETPTAHRPTHELDVERTVNPSQGAVIEIKNGAKSGQILPIDKPVTTLGRPGIQIAAIMRKPDGYFLMHIESDDSVDRPTLNLDSIGDEPVMLHSGDRLNVAGIDVEFMLS